MQIDSKNFTYLPSFDVQIQGPLIELDDALQQISEAGDKAVKISADINTIATDGM